MRVGGPAERVLTAHTKDELVQHALELWGSADPWLLLGGGSNTVVCDEGYPGTVLLVTHDEDLIDEVATRIWRVEHGRIEDFQGGYAELSARS